MKKLIAFLIFVGLCAAGYHFGAPPAREWWKKRNQPTFETVKVVKGDIKWSVQSTGTVEPVIKVQIGSVVSGPIVELNADFNDHVKKGDLLAKVDPRLYKFAVARDNAALLRAQADVVRVKARLQQTINDLKRGRQLQEINDGYISQAEMDQLRFTTDATEAEYKIAILQIDQAQANLDNSNLNLQYTDIEAPDDGVIIDRKIDPGQTLAANFQTPELFVLAPEMRKRMWVHAGVVEADVGHILKAKKEERPVEFYVDAYESELFTGKILQIRQNPKPDESVVTYPVIVETPNPDLKLLPGMTATLSFEIEHRKDILKIPSEAIRYVPEKKHVRKEDHEILEGKKQEERDANAEAGSAAARVEAGRRRRRRHVWVKEGDKLRGIEIEFGISDGPFYELIEGELEEGQELVHAVGTKGGPS